MLTNKSNSGASFPDAYARSKSPNSLWWLRFSIALGYRDISWLATDLRENPLQKRAREFGGIKAEIVTAYPPANVYQLMKCFEDYLHFPNVRISKELRSVMQACVNAWSKGGAEAFCERWNEGHYLFPYQQPGQTVEEYLNLTEQTRLL